MVRAIPGLNPTPSRSRWTGLLLLAVLVLGGGGLAYAFWDRLKQAYEDRVKGWKPQPASAGPVYLATRGDLVISVRESGTVQAANSIHISSEVEGQTRILNLVSESTRVEKGDLLVELDASKFQDELHQQEITLESARASLTEAQEALEIQKNQNHSDITAAELKLEFAQTDLKKYLEGDWPQERREAQTEITIAEEELKRSRDRLKWTQKLQEQGFVTRTELEADELSVKKGELALERAQEKFRILEAYAYPKKLKELEAAVEETKRELSRVIQKAKGQLLQKEAELRAKQATFALHEQKVSKLKDQIAKCRLTAPAPGLVVYYSPPGTGRRFQSSESLIEEGALVRERQRLITLPDVSLMRVEVQVHESEVDKVRAGLKAVVTVDALPGRRFTGRVKSIGLFADSQSFWLNPDLKVYSSEVLLDPPAEDLRPGMSAMVEMIVAELKNVVHVPIQAVTSHLGHECCYVESADHIEMRVVRLGLSNDKFVAVSRGVEPGEKVLLYQPEAGLNLVKVGFSPEAAAETGASQTDSAPEAAAAPESASPQAPAPGQKTAASGVPAAPVAPGPMPPEAAGSQPAESTRSAGPASGESSAASPAPEAAPAPDAAAQPQGRGGDWRERMKNMTPEQREEMRKRFESMMTPEQREEMRKRFESMSPEEREKMRGRGKGRWGPPGGSGESGEASGARP